MRVISLCGAAHFGEYNHLLSSFNKYGRDSFDYSAAICIPDMRQMVRHIFQHAIEKSTGIRISLLLQPPQFRHVIYTDKEQRKLTGMGKELSGPFYKCKKFSWQREARLVFVPNGQAPSERLIFHVPGIQRFVRLHSS
jgi:hypothetical protein